MECKYCKEKSIKKGFQTGIQKYYCKVCNKYFQEKYTYKTCTNEDDEMIVTLNNEGVGICGIARITGISKANVINKIKQIASKIKLTLPNEERQEYEMDELCTFIKNKENTYYIIYAINKVTKAVIDFWVGKRTKANINKVLESIKRLNPKRIFTDKLNIYAALIEKSIHVTTAHRINHIERFNLTLRTHLKRLTRRTICFSKNLVLLESCLQLYFCRKHGKYNAHLQFTR